MKKLKNWEMKKTMKDFVVNQKQSKEFARAIFASIREYVQNHQEEYEQFLRDEQYNKEQKGAA